MNRRAGTPTLFLKALRPRLMTNELIHKRFEALYNANRQDIYYYILRSVREPAAAQYLLQEVFINYFNHYAEGPPRGGDGIDDNERSRMILFRIARNLLINQSKSFHSKRISYTDTLPETQGAPDNEAEERLEAAEIQAVLDKLLAELDEEYRSILVLRYDRGMNLKDIAVIQGISVSAVSRKVRKAEQALLEESRKQGVNLMSFISLVFGNWMSLF